MNPIPFSTRIAGGVACFRLLGHLTALKASLVAIVCLLASIQVRANGFVFREGAPGNGSEPTQKAIILYDAGREDLVLQASYQGSEREFGWLIPVPGLPEIKQGSMKCFHDLSQLTQEPLWAEEFDRDSMLSSSSRANKIKAINIQTIGAFEVTVI